MIFKVVYILIFSLFTVSAPYLALETSQIAVALEDLADDQDEQPSSRQFNMFEEEIEHKDLAPFQSFDTTPSIVCYYKPLVPQMFTKDIDRPPSV